MGFATVCWMLRFKERGQKIGCKARRHDRSYGGKECQGYKATSAGDYSVLIQEEPGAGTLSFHITLTLPET